MAAKAITHSFRIYVRNTEWSLVDPHLIAEIEHYGEHEADEDGTYQIYRFAAHRCTVVNDISMSLSMSGVAHSLHCHTREA